MPGDRLDALVAFHPFTRLAGLLHGIDPAIGEGDRLVLSLGEPQASLPPGIADELAGHAAAWTRYPPAQGTAEFRAAVGDWLMRRYALPAGLIDPDRHVLPVAGSREALFMIALSAVPESSAWPSRPAVLMPNPFYHVYAGAAAVAGAEPIFLPAARETGFLPDPGAIDAGVLARTALAYVCSPANPQGAVASRAYLKRWLDLARTHDFVLAVDECYAEIYSDAPPPGALEVAAQGRDLSNLIVFHSLSKRSGVPGFRSGFIAGDARLVARQTQLVNYGGVAVPLPILAASTALWRDEEHVEAGRARYRANFALAERLIGRRFGWQRPAGGFFLWLEVGDGEAAARRLWRKAGLKVLPGAYLARADARGRNPGQAYIRVALVHDSATIETALVRLVEALDGGIERRNTAMAS
jgi:aspartate/methionine/tyrosine aminotransferase